MWCRQLLVQQLLDGLVSVGGQGDGDGANEVLACLELDHLGWEIQNHPEKEIWSHVHVPSMLSTRQKIDERSAWETLIEI
jgi:hypothetical protein